MLLDLVEIICKTDLFLDLFHKSTGFKPEFKWKTARMTNQNTGLAANQQD